MATSAGLGGISSLRFTLGAIHVAGRGGGGDAKGARRRDDRRVRKHVVLDGRRLRRIHASVPWHWWLRLGEAQRRVPGWVRPVDASGTAARIDRRHTRPGGYEPRDRRVDCR